MAVLTDGVSDAEQGEKIPEIRPNINVRRFQVFAEYSRIEKVSEGVPLDEAKGYGLWTAKVVASHMWSERAQLQTHQWGSEGDSRWFIHKGEPQTAEMFDWDIIRRVGEEFYYQVFSPAIQAAFSRGEKYADIRDKIREGWTRPPSQIPGKKKSAQ